MPDFDAKKFEQFKRSRANFDAQKYEQYKQTKESTLAREQQTTRFPIGSTIGGIAGSFTPWPNVTGAAGAALGDVSQTGVEAMMGRPHPEGSDILKSAGKEAAWSLAGGLAGQAVTKGLGKMLAPVASKIMPQAERTISYLEARNIRPGLLPAEATSSAMVDTAQNMAEHSLLGQNGILLYKQNRQAALDKIGDDLVEAIGTKTSPDQAGQAFLQSVAGNFNVEKAKAGVLYNTVETMVAPQTMIVTKTDLIPSSLLDQYGTPMLKSVERRVKEEAGGVRTPLASLKQFADPLAKQSTRLQSVEGRNVGDDLMHDIMTMPETITFSDAMSLRSRLLARVDQMSIENKNAPAIGKARQIVKRLDKAMDDALQHADPAALDMWREANRIYAKGQSQFNNSLIRRLSKSAMDDFGGNPEGVVKAVMKMGPSRIEKIKRAVDSPTWEKMQNVAAQELWKKGPDATGTVRGDNLLHALFGRTGLGDASVRSMFTPLQIKSMTDFANALKMTQDKIGVNTGGMLIQMKQAGALIEVGGLVTGTYGGHPLAGTMILLGPAAMSYIMTHPTLSKWLIQGIQLPKGSVQAGIVAGRLLAGLPPRYVNQEQGSATMTRPLEMTRPRAFAEQR